MLIARTIIYIFILEKVKKIVHFPSLEFVLKMFCTDDIKF